VVIGLAGCAATTSEVDRAALANRLSETFATQDKLDELTDRLAMLCMEADGFAVHPDPQTEFGDGTPRPFQHDNIEVAMGARVSPDWHGLPIDEVGYGLSPREMLGFDSGEGGPASQSEFDLLPADEQDEYLRRLHGYSTNDIDYPTGQRINEDQILPPNHEAFTRPDGWVVTYPLVGCVAEVQQELFGGEVRQFHELASQAAGETLGVAGRQVDSLPEVGERTREWAACMEQAGHEGLESPTDAQNRAGGSYGAAEVHGPGDPGFDELKQAEIELALADYGCNQEVALDELRADAFWDILAEHFEERESEVLEWHAMATDALTTGQEMLEQAGVQ
jgi:hypothetical protein